MLTFPNPLTAAEQEVEESSVALPPLTPEQRQAALDKAAASRRERAEVKNRLKHSGASLADVVAEGQVNEVIGKMRVSELLPVDARHRQGPGAPGDGEAQDLRDPPRARAGRQAGRGPGQRVRRPVKWS